MTRRKHAEDEMPTVVAGEALEGEVTKVDADAIAEAVAAEALATETPPEPPPWTKSENPIPPDWVARGRMLWSNAPVHEHLATDETFALATKRLGGGPFHGEPIAEWKGGDVGYEYFKGGRVRVTYRTGGNGLMKTSPVDAFDSPPLPPEVPAL